MFGMIDERILVDEIGGNRIQVRRPLYTNLKRDGSYKMKATGYMGALVINGVTC